MSAWLFTRLDWIIAWRHLRTGEVRPVWVMPLLIGAVYLIIVGAWMAWHASQLDVGVGPEMMGGGYEIPGTDMGPTPMQRYYGAFGGLTLVIGLMALVFGLLSFFFNLLPTIITMSVLLGCMALVVVLSLMSGLEGDLRDKILNQKAHVRVARADARPFEDYLPLVDAIAQAPAIPGRHTTVTNLPALVREGDYGYLDDPASIPEPDPLAINDEKPWRLRHLDKTGAIKVKGRSTGKDGKAAGKAGKLPGLPGPARGAPGDGAGDDNGGGDGWEDPAVEIPKLRSRGVLPSLSDLGGEPLTPEPEDDAWEEDGWEDPAVEIPKLREQGVLPEAPAHHDDEQAAPDQQDEQDEIDVPDEAILSPVLVGRELSMELSVRVGSQVQLITPVGRLTPAGRIPGQLWTKVGAVFFSGMYEYDRKNVYAPLSVVQKFLLIGDRVTGIEVKLDDVEAVDAGKAMVERVVAEQGRGDQLLVEDWRDLNRNLFSAMFLEKVAMFIALLFVVLVASFGILASNLMSVMEKAKEIAILKAMGTRDAGILRVFIAEGLCVGILGSFGGIGLGLGLCWALDRFGLPLNENVYYIEKLPVVVNPVEVALVGVAALVIVCFSSLYPALVASRLRPVDGLRQAD